MFVVKVKSSTTGTFHSPIETKQEAGELKQKSAEAPKKVKVTPLSLFLLMLNLPKCIEPYHCTPLHRFIQ
jgi:hypothetical protein